jgi:hypothetical protein
MNLFGKQVVVLFDCVTGRHQQIESFPFRITADAGADWPVQSVPQGEGCAVHRVDNRCQVMAVSPSGAIRLSGETTDGFLPIESETDFTIVAGDSLLALRATKKPQDWLAAMDVSQWNIFDSNTQTKHGPCRFSDLSQHIEELGGVSGKVVFPRGLETMGFRARDIMHLLPPPVRSTSANPAPAAAEPVVPEAEINSEYGEFTCPVCWLKFDRGDVMHIAVHASLRGDPLLGDAAMQRFQATRFNDRGQALDPMGIPAGDLACPHCRRKLPPGFLDLPHHIFSIIGAPSAGKSYYLSVLVKMLATSLYQNFGLSFRDADPSENVLLNDMKTQLFSAATPQEAALAKTQLEGAMYERLPRFGRKVPLPRPFIFQLGRTGEPGFSLVFYDNAGEHFEPTRNSADSPGAQHIASAAGLFFLFDPLTNVAFRRRIGEADDPQLLQRRTDQQEVILAECEARLKSILGIESGQRIGTPFAVIIGKCDTWLRLLGPEPLAEPVHQGSLDIAAIRANSTRVRALLLDLSPEIVANAEAISSDVMFFAASPLGSSPVAFKDAKGEQHIGPDPARLAPRWVEIPTLWVLSRIAPALVPAKT